MTRLKMAKQNIPSFTSYVVGYRGKNILHINFSKDYSIFQGHFYKVVVDVKDCVTPYLAKDLFFDKS